MKTSPTADAVANGAVAALAAAARAALQAPSVFNMRDLLAGVGEPYLVVRLGRAVGAEPPPAVPRRAPADAIEYID